MAGPGRGTAGLVPVHLRLAWWPHGATIDLVMIDVRLILPDVSDRTQGAHLIAVLAIMAVMSGTLLTWAKRQGWW